VPSPTSCSSRPGCGRRRQPARRCRADQRRCVEGRCRDGSTLLLAQGAIVTVYPYLYAKLGYDPVVDLQPVSLASEMLLGLAVGPAVPAEVTTLADFLAWMP
jgi:hypothetical protein